MQIPLLPSGCPSLIRGGVRVFKLTHLFASGSSGLGREMAIQRAIRRAVRERAFRLARHDLAMFLQDHEEELLQIFREEIQRLDDEIPEENFFIDIKMVPLGETVMKAVLRAMNRFLTGDSTAPAVAEPSAAKATEETSGDSES